AASEDDLDIGTAVTVGGVDDGRRSSRERHAGKHGDNQHGFGDHRGDAAANVLSGHGGGLPLVLGCPERRLVIVTCISPSAAMCWAWRPPPGVRWRPRC